MNVELLKVNQGQISYRRLGAGSRKILFFHGFPGSSQQIKLFNKHYKKHDLEVVCFDRVGYNKSQSSSDEVPLQENLNWANQLTQHLGWNQFEVISVSGGTPYGLSMSLLFPEKVLKTSVLCGLGDLCDKAIRKKFSKISLLIFKVLPHISGTLIKKIFSVQEQTMTRPTILGYFLKASTADLEIIKIPEVQDSILVGLNEAFKQNALGPKLDAKVFLTPWSINLEQYSNPIHFWHGDEDLVVPYNTSILMSQKIAHSKLTIIPHEGHFSLPFKYMDHILSAE